MKASVSIEELAEDIARWRSWQRSMLSAQEVLPLHVRLLPGDPREEHRVRRPGAWSQRHRYCECLPQESGELWDGCSLTIPTAAMPCSRIASR
jgi:hypothetical protein